MNYQKDIINRRIYEKVIICLCLVFSLFMISGCGVNGSAKGKEKFADLSYHKPGGFTDELTIKDDADKKILSYLFKEDSTGISMNYLKGEDYSYVEELYSQEPSEKKINGTTWRVLEDDSLGVKSTFYYTIHDGALYYIELNGIDKYPNEFDSFIKEVEFE